MSHIIKDYRNKNILEIVNESIHKRSFKLWDMDSFNLSEKEHLDIKELKLIRDVYKYNLVVKTDTLIQFFKSALESHDLIYWFFKQLDSTKCSIYRNDIIINKYSSIANRALPISIKYQEWKGILQLLKEMTLTLAKK